MCENSEDFLEKKYKAHSGFLREEAAPTPYQDISSLEGGLATPASFNARKRFWLILSIYMGIGFMLIAAWFWLTFLTPSTPHFTLRQLLCPPQKTLLLCPTHSQTQGKNILPIRKD